MSGYVASWPVTFEEGEMSDDDDDVSDHGVTFLGWAQEEKAAYRGAELTSMVVDECADWEAKREKPPAGKPDPMPTGLSAVWDRAPSAESEWDVRPHTREAEVSEDPKPLVETRIGPGPAWENCVARGLSHMSPPGSDTCVWCGATRRPINPEPCKGAKP